MTAEQGLLLVATLAAVFAAWTLWSIDRRLDGIAQMVDTAIREARTRSA
jgi:hypothetical protein